MDMAVCAYLIVHELICNINFYEMSLGNAIKENDNECEILFITQHYSMHRSIVWDSFRMFLEMVASRVKIIFLKHV